MSEIQFTGKVEASLELMMGKPLSDEQMATKPFSDAVVAWFPKLEMKDGNFVYLTRSHSEDVLYADSEQEALSLGKEYYEELMAIRSIKKEMKA